MKRRNLLVTFLVLLTVVLGACTPVATPTLLPATEPPAEPTQAVLTVVPSTLGPAEPANPTLILATTTSTQDSGLLDALVPRFQEQTGYTVQTVAVGSGQAMEMGQQGNADVLLVHSPAAEEQFMADGWGKDRELIMHNDFIIVGPAEDPAGIKGVVNLSADFLSKFHGMGALADITAPVGECGYTFLPNALSLCTFDSTIVAVPWYLNTYVLLYNRRLLRDGGFTERDLPTTYRELVRFIRAYRDRTGKFALFWNIGKDSYLPVMLGSEGVALTDEALTRAAFDTPRGIELIDEWVQVYRAGYLQSESIIKPGSQIV